MNSNKGKQKFFVIYQITNLLDNRIYVGLHSTYNIDDKYMGSSKHLKKDLKELGRQNFKKKILHVFDNKEDMMKKEAEIVNREFCHRTDTYNRMIGGQCYNILDMLAVKDKDGNKMLVYNNDPRWLSGELVGVNKGIHRQKEKIIVKDKNDNKFMIDSNDPRFLSGELVGHTKGLPQHPNFSWKDKKHSEETKNKMSEKAKNKIGNKNSQFGTCWITNGVDNKKVKKENLDEYIIQGWKKGRRIIL